MISTAYGKDHALWDQIVRKETEAKKRFEFMTGQTTATKFFNGTNVSNVDKNLMTMASMIHSGDYSRTPQPKQLSSKHGSARYNSQLQGNKADVLSKALSDVISEKRSQRGSSSTVSKSYVVVQHPLMATTMNAKSFRDVDSQADRYRQTIRTMQGEQLQCTGADPHKIAHTSGVYPVQRREGVFDRNIKEGIKYADNKTKAKKFELDKIS